MIVIGSADHRKHKGSWKPALLTTDCLQLAQAFNSDVCTDSLILAESKGNHSRVCVTKKVIYHLTGNTKRQYQENVLAVLVPCLSWSSDQRFIQQIWHV